MRRRRFLSKWRYQFTNAEKSAADACDSQSMHNRRRSPKVFAMRKWENSQDTDYNKVLMLTFVAPQESEEVISNR